MRVTLGEFIDNIEKNGFPQIIGELFGSGVCEETGTYQKHPDFGACALGQGVYNTFGHVLSDSRSLDFWRELDYNAVGFTDTVVDLNDGAQYDIPAIVEIVRKTYAEQLDVIIWEQE